ncbi:MAG: hypothetical protein FJX47_06360 [Alphaproteobacteria bacterium]|nr:hypothetical protein [Alphaproteobacteria bacterium]
MIHRYPLSSLRLDYLRSVLGLGLTGAPLLLASPGFAMMVTLGSLAALFGAFGVRTALRQATAIEVSDSGIRSMGPMGSAMGWEDIVGLRLHYFSMRRGKDAKGSGGWMQATLRAGRRTIRFDSDLDGFETVIGRVHAEALSRGLALDPATRHNLGALGFSVGDAP